MVHQDINEFLYVQAQSLGVPSVGGFSPEYPYYSEQSSYGSISPYPIGSPAHFSIANDDASKVLPQRSCHGPVSIRRPGFFLPCGCYSQLCKPGVNGGYPHKAQNSHCWPLLASDLQLGLSKPVVITLVNGVSISFPLGLITDDTKQLKISNLYETIDMEGYKPVIRNQRTPYSFGIDIIWKRHFQIVAPSFPDSWILMRVEEMLEDKEAYRDTENFHCHCSVCSHEWVDLEGTIIFYYSNEPFDTIKYFINGSKCPRCSKVNKYPDLYSSDAYSAINVLTNAIAFCVYGMVQNPTAPIPFGANLPLRHETSLCEGCQAGFCGPNKSIN